MVNPYALGGTRLAHPLAKPAVVDFLDVSSSLGAGQLVLEEVRLAAAGPFAGRTLA